MPDRGFTLVELMITVSIAALLVLLAAPSFQNMILMQRLRGVNTQLVTDQQYARSEALASGLQSRVMLEQNEAETCYTLFVASDPSFTQCDCTRGAGNACTTPETKEIKTVTLPRSEKVILEWPADQSPGYGFDPVTGGLVTSVSDLDSLPLVSVTLTSRIDDERRLNTVVLQTGRPKVCAPHPERMQVPAC